MPQSKIKTLQFVSEWKAPQGHTLYVHDIEFDNGDRGKTYLKSKLPTELLGGAEATYTINGAAVRDVVVVRPMSSESASNAPAGYNFNNLNTAGYCVSHAKDLVVAQIMAKDKTLKDPVDAIKKISEELYAHTIDLSTRPF